MTDNAPTQAWRIASTKTGHVEISKKDGKYLLVVEPCEGNRWEADATEAVAAAAAHETESLRKELEIALAAVDRESELHEAAKAQLRAQGEELEFARDMLRRAAERGFLDQLGQG